MPNPCMRSQEPGSALAGKLCAHLRPKCHPLLFDSALNSPATVRLNLYQLMLLAAMKLHCQARAPLPNGVCGTGHADFAPALVHNTELAINR